MTDLPIFADLGRLLARVAHAVHRGDRVAFLFGSALTAPGSTATEKGVPGASALVDEVVQSFQGLDELNALEEALRRSEPSARYQQAMQFVIDCRGQDALNDLIRKSVLKARISPARGALDLAKVEMDTQGWYLRPAVEAVGQLVREHPSAFSAPILTSNFDPLVEVSIRKAGGHAAAIFLSTDGQFTNILSPGSNVVVHFHGFWRGSDTLHTPAQLMRNRPQLKGCLRSMLRETTLVVLGYGGWSDVFTRTLIDVISEQTEELNVLWAFYSDNEDDIVSRNQLLLKQFEALTGQRVVLYKGVDCHIFLPRLREKLASAQSVSSLIGSIVTQPVVKHPPQGSDHPPLADAWVGREMELRAMLSSRSKVITITGLGGIGKSTLAAKYLELRHGAEEIAYFCWADCREQSNTLHTQLVRMVERVSDGAVRASQLAESNTDNTIEVLFELLGATRAVLVFDNIDQYVDVEDRKATGTMGKLLHEALVREHSAQFVFTGRPTLEYSDPRCLEVRLEGLSLEEVKQVFTVRGVILDLSKGGEQMAEVHRLTQGHALTINLIATQVARNRADLAQLIAALRAGSETGGENPIFLEIWNALNQKQQTVLRYLAELVHPEPEQRAASYLGDALNYNQFSKSIRVLKALNLVVVKSPGGSAMDTIELHPLIRDFIRRRFPKSERVPYIDSIILICNELINRFRPVIFTAPYSVLEAWTAKVELCLERELFSDALLALAEVCGSLQRNGYGEELVRLASELFRHYKLTDNELETELHDGVYRALITTLSELGRGKEADEWSERLESAIPGKTARYIAFCDTRAYSYWLRLDYDKAKEWAQRGIALKASANLDTRYDCRHTLALAQRDSGDVKLALEAFLEGETLAVVTDKKQYDPQRRGSFYGNIGRCLWFDGLHDEALICYKKSARTLEKESNRESSMNLGWAAYWIGEVLEAKMDLEMAFVAFRRAVSRWKSLSPSRARQAGEAVERVKDKLPSGVVLPVNDWECERIYLDWLNKN